MVLVHDQGNVRIGLNGGLDQVLDKGFPRVFAGASAGLQNDRRANLIGRSHDGLYLLQVVDIESWNAIAIDGGMVQ